MFFICPPRFIVCRRKTATAPCSQEWRDGECCRLILIRVTATPIGARRSEHRSLTPLADTRVCSAYCSVRHCKRSKLGPTDRSNLEPRRSDRSTSLEKCGHAGGRRYFSGSATLPVMKRMIFTAWRSLPIIAHLGGFEALRSMGRPVAIFFYRFRRSQSFTGNATAGRS